jgi:hypothetical protein
MGIPVSVTLSSSGIGRAVDLDWMSGKFTAHTETFSSSGTALSSAMLTLRVLQRIGQ